MEQFKKGDWVVHNGKHKLITKMIDGLIDCLDYNTAIILKNDQLELWIPEPGEWCWSKGSIVKAFIFQWTTSHYYDSTKYEPFIGKLPYNLKG